MSPRPSPPPGHPAGLCADCQHHRAVANRRGSRFYLCERSRTDPRYPRYPRLPVLECEGFEPGGMDPYEKEFGWQTRST